ncbi:hypothetical protein EVAR_15073_1 [Eumeta japonica]|uniref:Mos1 transposase HTH domain-containing protein n=1 Tax=Eumeta variegata TaxID=151549 RepID=A0A4C1YLF1_EUMVA|nr:hypothetical protein EVAR_15073_1 [Eumeta japonica]
MTFTRIFSRVMFPEEAVSDQLECHGLASFQQISAFVDGSVPPSLHFGVRRVSKLTGSPEDVIQFARAAVRRRGRRSPEECRRAAAARRILMGRGHGAEKLEVTLKVAQNWFRRFQFSNFDVKIEPRSGQPLADKADAISEKVEQDRHISYYDVAEKMEIDYKTVLMNLKKRDIQIASYFGFIRAN